MRNSIIPATRSRSPNGVQAIRCAGKYTGPAGTCAIGTLKLYPRPACTTVFTPNCRADLVGQRGLDRAGVVTADRLELDALAGGVDLLDLLEQHLALLHGPVGGQERLGLVGLRLDPGLGQEVERGSPTRAIATDIADASCVATLSRPDASAKGSQERPLLHLPGRDRWHEVGRCVQEGAVRWFRSLSTGDKIQAVAVAVAILALISGALVTIFVPEIRCSVHLDKCPKQIPPGGASSSASPPQFVDAPPDASKPYIVAKPKPHGLAGRALFAELNFVEMTNRGRPVVVPLSGSAATANGSVRVEMLDPGGSTFYSTSLDTDDRGLFATKLLWVPLQYLGVQGNDGAWKIRLEDMLTGEQTAVQLTVSSDDQTPEPAQWRQGDDLGLVPSKPATVEAATSGTLCSAAAMYSRVALSGFTPKASITISFLRPDGQRVGSSGVFADGAGEVAPRFTYWQIASDLCKSPINFQYQVVAVEDGTNRRADAKILLPTR